MGLPSRSFAADAHDCIMVWIRMESTEYKGVARYSAPDGELPSDHHPKALVTPRHNGRWICGRSAAPTGSASPASRASSKSEEMLAFAHIPTGPTNKEN
jgi:hypothetical protein